MIVQVDQAVVPTYVHTRVRALKLAFRYKLLPIQLLSLQAPANAKTPDGTRKWHNHRGDVTPRFTRDHIPGCYRTAQEHRQT